MKIIYKYKEDILYKMNQITNGHCNLCKSDNVYNNRCLDCGFSNKELYFIERYINNKTHYYKLDFELSLKQKKASNFFLEKYMKKENAYLNAVCGSGKTEIMYETINYALNNNDKVLIAIPRKEIVMELYNRLKEVFVNTTIKALDGLHHDDNAELLISTVHQLIHYEDEFDLIILDEADAYPFSFNDYLKRLLHKSLKKDGVLIVMSATEKEKIKYEKFTLNRRYHNHDLKMPEFYKINEEDVLYSKEFNNIISNKDRKFIIYTSSIKKALYIGNILNSKVVSSKNEHTQEIVEDFKRNNDKLLVSTTILERGITIKGLDVIIIDASSSVFTKETIIQICGRVGRKIDDPIGNIYIFYQTNSLKFRRVREYINRMNI